VVNGELVLAGGLGAIVNTDISTMTNESGWKLLHKRDEKGISGRFGHSLLVYENHLLVAFGGCAKFTT